VSPAAIGGDSTWEVTDIRDVQLQNDGSMTCEIVWAPTRGSIEDLQGDDIIAKCENLIREAYGEEELQRQSSVWGKS